MDAIKCGGSEVIWFNTSRGGNDPQFDVDVECPGCADCGQGDPIGVVIHDGCVFECPL